MDQPSAQRKREDIVEQNLKRVYDETLDDCVPDRFRVLLDALKQQEKSRDYGK